MMTERKLSSRLGGVIFDVGGVLLHPDGGLVSRVIEPILGRRLDPQACQDSFLLADYQRSHGVPPGDDMAVAWAKVLHLPTEVAVAAWQRVNQLDQEIPNLWGVVHPCAARVLQALRATGLKTGVLSNAQGNVEHLLVMYGLRDYVDDIVDSACVGIEKPDPAIFLLALHRLGLQAFDCIYLGDSLGEVQTAQRLQMRPVLYDRLGLYQQADYMMALRDLCELPTLLARMVAS